MSHVIKMFNEFKSIFFTEDVLKENEAHANIVTATTMLNLFLICLLTWVLVSLNVFKVRTEIMNIVLLMSAILLLIPAISCFLLKGNKKWIKNILFICFIVMLAVADAILKYNVTLLIVIPVILAARYYTKKFTIGVAVLTTITFIISACLSIKVGQQDLNTYNLIIPEGTVLSVNSTLRDAVTAIEVDEIQRLKNVFIHFLIPKLFVFSIVVFACVQISQSGKNMVTKQEEISKKGARIATELELANNIQKNMLPSIFPPFPEHEEIDIYAAMIPAKEVRWRFL